MTGRSAAARATMASIFIIAPWMATFTPAVHRRPGGLAPPFAPQLWAALAGGCWLPSVP